MLPLEKLLTVADVANCTPAVISSNSRARDSRRRVLPHGLGLAAALLTSVRTPTVAIDKIVAAINPSASVNARELMGRRGWFGLKVHQ